MDFLDFFNSLVSMGSLWSHVLVRLGSGYLIF